MVTLVLRMDFERLGGPVVHAFLQGWGKTPFKTRHGPAIPALIKLENSAKWVA
jgi:hypothetical protein